MARLVKQRGHTLIAITSMEHSTRVNSRHPSGLRARRRRRRGARQRRTLRRRGPAAARWGSGGCGISSITAALLAQRSSPTPWPCCSSAASPRRSTCRTTSPAARSTTRRSRRATPAGSGDCCDGPDPADRGGHPMTLVIGMDVGGTSSRAMSPTCPAAAWVGLASGGNPVSHGLGPAMAAIRAALEQALEGVPAARSRATSSVPPGSVRGRRTPHSRSCGASWVCPALRGRR